MEPDKIKVLDETEFKEKLLKIEHTFANNDREMEIINELPDPIVYLENKSVHRPVSEQKDSSKENKEFLSKTGEITLQKPTSINDQVKISGNEIYIFTVFEINRYLILEEIGTGGSGKVVKAWDNKRAKYVAIKTFKYINEGIRELENLRKLPEGSKNFLHLRNIQSNKEGTEIFLIIEYGLCDLNDLLIERLSSLNSCSDTEKNKIFYSEKEILHILLDVLESLLDLKKVKMKHNDIKEKNIVYCGIQSRYFVIDFNICNDIDVQCKGYTKNYSNKHVKKEKKRDVWSLGVTLFNLISFNCGANKIKLEGIENDEAVRKAFEKNPNEYSAEFKELLAGMLNAKKIPTLEELKMKANLLMEKLNKKKKNNVFSEHLYISETKKDEHWARKAEFRKLFCF